MPFIIPQKILSEMLALAARVAGRGSTIPIIGCVKIAFGAGISISATDMDKWITLSTSDFDPKGCQVAVTPAKQMAEMIAALPAGDIELELNGNRLTAKTSASRYNFGSLPETDWPMIEWKKGNRVKLTGAEFASAIGFVVPSVSSDITRTHLTGIGIRTQGDNLRLMASDGFQFAHALTPFHATAEPVDTILPRETGILFQELCDGASEEVVIEFGTGKCRLEVGTPYGEVVVMSRMVDAQFPDVDRLVPYERESTVYSINRADLAGSITRISRMSASDKFNGIRIDFSESDAIISAKSDNGDALERIKAVVPANCDLYSFWVKGSVMARMMGLLKNEQISLRCNKDNSMDAVVVCDTEGKVTPDLPRFFIIMPMRG